MIPRPCVGRFNNRQTLLTSVSPKTAIIFSGEIIHNILRIAAFGLIPPTIFVARHRVSLYILLISFLFLISTIALKYLINSDDLLLVASSVARLAAFPGRDPTMKSARLFRYIKSFLLNVPPIRRSLTASAKCLCTSCLLLFDILRNLSNSSRKFKAMIVSPSPVRTARPMSEIGRSCHAKSEGLPAPRHFSMCVTGIISGFQIRASSFGGRIRPVQSPVRCRRAGRPTFGGLNAVPHPSCA